MGSPSDELHHELKKYGFRLSKETPGYFPRSYWVVATTLKWGNKEYSFRADFNNLDGVREFLRLVKTAQLELDKAVEKLRMTLAGVEDDDLLEHPGKVPGHPDDKT